MSKRKRLDQNNTDDAEKHRKIEQEKSLLEIETLRSEYEKNKGYVSGGETALHFAAFLGHADVVKVLIQNGSKLNAGNERKQTALHFATQKGHVTLRKCYPERCRRECCR